MDNANETQDSTDQTDTRKSESASCSDEDVSRGSNPDPVQVVPPSKPPPAAPLQVLPPEFCNVIFSRAIDVACAAKTAQEHVAQVAQKADYISKLAELARQESEALHDVAADMAATAKSVAQVAMDVCQFDNLEEAYNSSVEWHQKIDLDSLSNVLHPEFHPPEALLQQRRSQRQERAPRERASTASPTDIPITIRTVKAGQSGSPNHQSSERRWSLPMRNSGSGLKIPDHGSSFTIPGQERFPSRPSVEDRKESMAAVFDSTQINSTLWEDRYCSVARESDTTPDGKSSDHHWQKKKAMKQFQIRLHQNTMLDSSGSSNECVTGERHNPGSFSVVRANRKATEHGAKSPTSHGKHKISKHLHIDSDSSLGEISSSSDSELEEILLSVRPSNNKPLNKLKALEKLEPHGKHYSSKRPTDDGLRTVSPLLNTNEREHLVVSGDESGPLPPQRYIFTPVVHSSKDIDGS